jgi:hypothetical protein
MKDRDVRERAFAIPLIKPDTRQALPIRGPRVGVPGTYSTELQGIFAELPRQDLSQAGKAGIVAANEGVRGG